MLRLLAVVLVLMFPVTGRADGVTSTDPAAPHHHYGLDYVARMEPEAGVVRMSLRARQESHLLRQVRFKTDPARYLDLEGDGEIERNGDTVTWHVPAAGGSLRYAVVLDHRRGKDGYDSRLTADWAVFRGDDLLPPAHVVAEKGAHSLARLRLEGPQGWIFVTPYPKSEKHPEWRLVDWPDRRFDRPVGWMAAGKLGVRRETIAGAAVAVAGPIGQGIRYLDLLAFLRWNLPTVRKVFPAYPERLLIVSAGDPMWRGGLSGPDSLYIHADRPLISGNGTSTLLHELIHVAQGYRANRDEDWIVEGMAEYYTLEIMRRSGTISRKRFDIGLGKLAEWARQAKSLNSNRSSGARTARGALVMRDLDSELRKRSGGKYSLDDVARQLSADRQAVSLEQLREISAKLVGGPLQSLSNQHLGLE